MKALLFVITMFGFIASAQAETRYIVDQAKLPMRAGQSTSHTIVRMLPSGMSVEVLEQSATGYTHIRTNDGRDGWILSRYLMKHPAARDLLVRAESELSKFNTLKRAKQSLEQQQSKLKSENKDLQSALTRIRKTAANAVVIAKENKALSEKAAAAERALNHLRRETSDIRSGAQQRWFMLGAGAILFGIILGLILPRLKFRRKDRWGRY